MATYLNSLQSGMHDTFAADPSVYLIGEDLLDPYGGAFKVSKGLSSSFPGRVLSTPISEAGFTGIAIGMALRGLKPIVEIMFGDFLTLCTDQIVNHIAKFRGMYGKEIHIPIVIRTPMGGGRGYGATHSQSLEKLFLGIPDIQVVAPSHAHDPGRLLRYSVLDNPAPVLFIENKMLYPLALVAEEADLGLESIDEIVGYPTTIIKNYSGGSPDITLLAYGGMSRHILPLLKTLRDDEIRVLAVLPSSLKPVPINTLTAMAEQSRRVIIAEEGTGGFNWGSEIAAMIYERLFGKLLAPIQRVCSAEAVIPAAQRLEDEVLINAGKIEQAVMRVLS